MEGKFNKPVITKMSLSAWREYRRMEQKEVAKKLGITASALSHYEHYRRPIPEPIVNKLISLYKCPKEMMVLN